MQFFKVTDEFLDWLVAFAVRRPILDVGCGEGQLLRGLLERTPLCHGLTPFLDVDPDLEGCCTEGEVEDARIARKEGWLLVLARPSHEGMVEATLKGAISQVLILTRPSTIKEDVGPYTVEKIDVPGLLPADDGEEICGYLYTPKRTPIWEEYEGGDWFSDCGRYYLSPMGHVCPKDTTDPGEKTGRSVCHWRCIQPDPFASMAAGRLGDNPDEYHAWVTPRGQRFTCEHYEHSDIARCMGFDPWELEQMGWRSTWRDEGGAGIFYHGGDTVLIKDRPITQEQYKSLDILNQRYLRHRRKK